MIYRICFGAIDSNRGGLLLLHMFAKRKTSGLNLQKQRNILNENKATQAVALETNLGKGKCYRKIPAAVAAVH